MSKKVTISVRIDKEEKEQIEQICKAIGLTPSDAIKIFLRKLIIEEGFPFSVKAFNKK